MTHLQFQIYTLKILHRWPEHLLRWWNLFGTKEIEFFVCHIFLSSLSPSILESNCLRIYREKFLRIDLLIRFGKKISKISSSQLVWFFFCFFFPTNFFSSSLAQESDWSYYYLYNYGRVLFYFCFCLYFWMTCKQCKYMYFVNMCKNWLCIIV